VLAVARAGLQPAPPHTHTRTRTRTRPPARPQEVKQHASPQGGLGSPGGMYPLQMPEPRYPTGLEPLNVAVSAQARAQAAVEERLLFMEGRLANAERVGGEASRAFEVQSQRVQQVRGAGGGVGGVGGRWGRWGPGGRCEVWQVGSTGGEGGSAEERARSREAEPGG
jgi:hypothetical protein